MLRCGVRYLLPVLACLLCLSGCTASRLSLNELIDASFSRFTHRDGPQVTSREPRVSKSSKPSVQTPQPVEASFAATTNLDRF